MRNRCARPSSSRGYWRHCSKVSGQLPGDIASLWHAQKRRRKIVGQLLVQYFSRYNCQHNVTISSGRMEMFSRPSAGGLHVHTSSPRRDMRPASESRKRDLRSIPKTRSTMNGGGVGRTRNHQRGDVAQRKPRRQGVSALGNAARPTRSGDCACRVPQPELACGA